MLCAEKTAFNDVYLNIFSTYVTLRMIRYPIVVSSFAANSLLSMQGIKSTKRQKLSLARKISYVISPILILYQLG